MKANHRRVLMIAYAVSSLTNCAPPLDPPPPSQMGDGCESPGPCLPKTLFFTGATISDVGSTKAAPYVTAFEGQQDISVWLDLDATMPFDIALEHQEIDAICTKADRTADAFCAFPGSRDIYSLVSTPPKITIKGRTIASGEEETEDKLIIASPYPMNGGRGATYTEIGIKFARRTEMRMVPPDHDFTEVHGDWRTNPWIAFARNNSLEQVTIGLIHRSPDGSLKRIVDQSLSYEINGVVSMFTPWDRAAAPSSAFQGFGNVVTVRRATQLISTIPIAVTTKLEDIEIAQNRQAGPFLPDLHILPKDIPTIRCFSAFDSIDTPRDGRQRHIIYGVNFTSVPSSNFRTSALQGVSEEERRSCFEITSLTTGDNQLGIVGEVDRIKYTRYITFSTE